MGKIKFVAAECIQGFELAGLGLIVADQYTRTSTYAHTHVNIRTHAHAHALVHIAQGYVCFAGLFCRKANTHTYTHIHTYQLA